VVAEEEERVHAEALEEAVARVLLGDQVAVAVHYGLPRCPVMDVQEAVGPYLPSSEVEDVHLDQEEVEGLFGLV